MNHSIRIGIAACLFALAASTWGVPPAYTIVINEEKNPSTPTQITAYVKAWINCFECTNGELQRVVDSGTDALADLAKVLAGDAEFFPDRSAEYEQQWLDVKSYTAEVRREISLTQLEFVAYQEGALRTVYRARAEKAAAIIHAKAREGDTDPRKR